MFALIGRFAREESGQALVEYGAVIGLIVAGCIAVMLAFREQLQTLFSNIASTFSDIPQ